MEFRKAHIIERSCNFPDKSAENVSRHRSFHTTGESGSGLFPYSVSKETVNVNGKNDNFCAFRTICRWKLFPLRRKTKSHPNPLLSETTAPFQRQSGFGRRGWRCPVIFVNRPKETLPSVTGGRRRFGARNLSRFLQRCRPADNPVRGPKNGAAIPVYAEGRIFMRANAG